MYLKIPICLISLAFVLISCNPRYVDEKGMAKYIGDDKNGLKNIKNVNEVYISVIYKPSQLIAVQELKTLDSVNEHTINELNINYGRYLYFILSIKRSGKDVLSSCSDKDEYNILLQTLLFGMKDYVTLLGDGLDTLKLMDYTYPRMYGASASTDLLFAFQKNTQKTYENLVFNLDDIGLGIGTQKIVFKTKDIDNVPQLKYSSN